MEKKKDEETKIILYGEDPKVKVRKNGHRLWTPEEDKKLMQTVTGNGKLKALGEELGRSVPTMYQRIHTLCNYESRYDGRRKLPTELHDLVVKWKSVEHKRGRKPKNIN